MNELKFLKCPFCGNIILMVKDSSVIPVCCNHEMTVLKPNTSDGATEKHVPAVIKEGNKLKVQIGSVAHPMTPEHYIEFIAIGANGKIQIKYLSPEDEPKAEFTICEDCDISTIKVYEYCNLHGLWSTK